MDWPVGENVEMRQGMEGIGVRCVGGLESTYRGSLNFFRQDVCVSVVVDSHDEWPSSL